MDEQIFLSLKKDSFSQRRDFADDFLFLDLDERF
jgi:hypothetical protein